MKVPLQARSQKTLEKLTRATETLLETHDWSSIQVQSICAKAKVSVGSFYARFDNKEALLDHLDDLYTQSVLENTKSLGHEIATAACLKDAVELLTNAIHNFYTEKTGLSRALIMRARSGHVETRSRTRQMTDSIPDLIVCFKPHSGEILHDDWERAMRECVGVSFHALRENLLFSQSLDIAIPGKRLRNMLTRMICLHLKTGQDFDTGRRPTTQITEEY